jgi:hypothetical protein
VNCCGNFIGAGPSAKLPSLGYQSFYGTQASSAACRGAEPAVTMDDGYWTMDNGWPAGQNWAELGAYVPN